MFFTSVPELPFATIRDVMRAYPGESSSTKHISWGDFGKSIFFSEWKLLMKSYNDAYFDVLAGQGDPDYKTFYDRVQGPNRKEAVYNTFIEGTRRIAEERAVLHAPDLMLFYHFVDNPQVYAIPQNVPELYNYISLTYL